MTFDVAKFDRLAIAAMDADKVVADLMQSPEPVDAETIDAAQNTARNARDAFNRFIAAQMLAARDRASG